MKRRRWCERFRLNLWIFRQEEFPNANLPPLSCANVFVKSSPTMQIPIQLVVPSHTMKAVEKRALIDSGASISCIDWGFIRKQIIPTQCLKTPIQARNTNNSVNSKGVIRFTTTLFLDIGGITRRATLYVMNLGNKNVILGLPWLKDVNLLRPCKLLVGTPETPELVGVGWDLALACVLCPCC